VPNPTVRGTSGLVSRCNGHDIRDHLDEVRAAGEVLDAERSPASSVIRASSTPARRAGNASAVHAGRRVGLAFTQVVSGASARCADPAFCSPPGIGIVGFVVLVSPYNRTYGSLAAVIIFLVWMWISNLAILIGAEFDAELQRGRAIQAGHPIDDEPYLTLRDTPATGRGGHQEL